MKTLPTQKRSAVKPQQQQQQQSQASSSVSKILVKSTRSAGPTPLKKRILHLGESIKSSSVNKSAATVSSSSASSSPITTTTTPKVLKGQIAKGVMNIKTPQSQTMPAKIVSKKVVNVSKVQEEKNVMDSPTVAAGRSRRAIKPNPKYASEDIVTPKIMKQGGKSAQKSAGGIEKHRTQSQSSSDDFFNRESSDDFEEPFSKAASNSVQNRSGPKDVDSDFEVVATPEVKKRGRPRKHPLAQSTAHKPSNSASNTSAAASVQSTPRTISISKPISEQLQQLRRSLNNSTLINRKRKLEDDADDSPAPPTIVRRLQINSATPINRKILAGRIANGESPGRKIINAGPNEKRIKIAVSEKPTGQSPSILKLQKADLNSKALLNKKRSASPMTRSPTTPKASAAEEKNRSSNNNNKNENDNNTSPSSGVEDFETMPTFTIVNIHDIINKKGDVLISKAVKKRPATGNNENSEKTQQVQSKGVAPTTKPGVKHINVAASKGTQGNNRPTGSAGSAEKGAPRILNSMVARKTPPVKPVIANLEDSTEEDDDEVSLNLLSSLSTSDEEVVKSPQKTRETRQKLTSSAKETESVGNTPNNNKVVSRPVASALKKRNESLNASATATKENLSGATNRTPARSTRPILPASKPPSKQLTSSSAQPPSRKTSPEKVTISREGDKIVKKITCFETWYVINVPEDKSGRPQRSSFELPLIELANGVSTMKLPNEEWSAKVTLFELPPSVLEKSEDFVEYTGDLKEHNIPEEDRKNYQPSAVLFRRAVKNRALSRLPYDRAIIFKNKTFSYNIDGKNVRLVGAPPTISSIEEVQTLLEILEFMTLDSDLIEAAQSNN